MTAGQELKERIELKNKKKRKHALRIVLGLEILAITVIFLYVIVKGDISFHTIGAKETLKETEEGASSVAGSEGDGTEGKTEEGTQVTKPSQEAEGRNDTIGKEDDTGPAGADPGRSGADPGTAGTDSGTTGPVTGTDGGKQTDPTGTGGLGSGMQDQTGTDPEGAIGAGAGAENKDITDTITISVAGDVTLGRDLNYGYENSFDHELERQGNDYSYFFRNVKEIFEQDDITIVNLETTLTTSKKPAEKKFRFKADPSYVEILKQGDIEVVNVANNHTYDYLDQGYTDTLATLKKAEVGYFGYDMIYLQEIRGIKVGMAGFVSWEATKGKKEEIRKGIEKLKEAGADIVIVMFHWGIEKAYTPNTVQKELAHYSIDQGADLVLGAHPHVLQGVEEYKGKQIVYSLGNFSFGGNKNPSDKDSMVYVHKFHFKNKELVGEEKEIIPCSISSVKNRNNYQPTPLEGKEKKRVLDKIEKYSKF